MTYHNRSARIIDEEFHSYYCKVKFLEFLPEMTLEEISHVCQVKFHFYTHFALILSSFLLICYMFNAIDIV